MFLDLRRPGQRRDESGGSGERGEDGENTGLETDVFRESAVLWREAYKTGERATATGKGESNAHDSSPLDRGES